MMAPFHNILLPSAFLLLWSASSATGFGNSLSFSPEAVSKNAPIEISTMNKLDRHRRRLRLSPTISTRLLASNENRLDARGGQVKVKAPPSSTTKLPIETTNEQHLARFGRCSMAFVGCLLTVGLRKEPRISAIVASALTGLVACGVGYAPVAAFCGSFAGMSAHASTIGTALPMALAVSCIYGIFDAWKLLVGVGGRLGLIALVSNLLVVSLGLVDKVGIQAVAMDMVQKLGGWKTTASLTFLVFMTKVVSRIPAVKDKSAIKAALKTSVMGLFAFASIPNPSASQLKGLATSFLAIYASTMVIQESDGVVFPVALLGLVGALLLPQYAAAIYLGGFIGMTGKPKFRSGQAAQASFVAAVALVSGLWNGLGGRLGTQAAVSVLFSLT